MNLIDLEILASDKKVEFADGVERIRLPKQSYKIRLINHNITDANAVLKIENKVVWKGILPAGEKITLPKVFNLKNQTNLRLEGELPLLATAKDAEIAVMMLSQVNSRKTMLPIDNSDFLDVRLLPY